MTLRHHAGHLAAAGRVTEGEEAMTAHASARVARRVLAGAALAGLVLAGPVDPSAASDRPFDVACPARLDLVVVAEHAYTLAVRVRPLLFWIRRDNVGDARLTWSAGPVGTRRLEFLIGSDPERTPMRINRWGYLAETTCGGAAALVGVMTESDEQSVEEARASTEGGGRGGHAFKAIRSSFAAGESRAEVTRLVVAENFTYRDVDVVLQRALREAGAARRLQVVAGTESGFLVAVAALVHERVEAFARTGRVERGPATTRTFVYGDRLFDLSIRSSTLVPALVAGGVHVRPVIESEFEVRNLTTKQRTPFRIAYGTEAPFAEVPVRVVYRPRWWFEAELLLVTTP